MAGRFWLKHLKSAPVDMEDDGGRDFQGFNFNFKNRSRALEDVDSEIQFCFLAAASALLSVRSFASIELVFCQRPLWCKLWCPRRKPDLSQACAPLFKDGACFTTVSPESIAARLHSPDAVA